jgi:hypothetical protein
MAENAPVHDSKVGQVFDRPGVASPLSDSNSHSIGKIAEFRTDRAYRVRRWRQQRSWRSRLFDKRPLVVRLG